MIDIYPSVVFHRIKKIKIVSHSKGLKRMEIVATSEKGEKGTICFFYADDPIECETEGLDNA